MSPGEPRISSAAWFLFRPNSPAPAYVFWAAMFFVVDALVWAWAATLPNKYQRDGDTWTVEVPNAELLLFICVPVMMIVGGSIAVRGAVRDWGRLEGLCSESSAGLADRAFRFGPGSVAKWSLVGVLLAVAHLVAAGELENLLTHFMLIRAVIVTHIVFVWVLIAQIAGVFVRVCGGFNRLGRVVTPSLVQPRALSPFSNVGLRMMATLSGILVLAVLLSDFPFVFFVVPFVVVTAVCLITFFLPQLGARASMRRAKQEAREAIDEEIVAIGFPGVGAGGDESSRRSIADLLAVRAAVEVCPDWPISAGNAVRVVCGLLLPLVSWGVSYLLDQIPLLTG